MKKTQYLPAREEESFARHCRLAKALARGRVRVFDVGANIGQSICRYRSVFPHCLITSFEPNPKAFARLKRRWDAVPGIVLRREAVSDSAGTLDFHVMRVPEASSLLKPTKRMVQISTQRKYDYETVRVPTETLDRYCARKRIGQIDILKVDVQGSELRVLRGAKELLRNGRIVLIYSEVTLAETYDSQTRFADLVGYLSDLNYEVWDMGAFLYTRNDRLWAANVTFVHASAARRLESRSDREQKGLK